MWSPGLATKSIPATRRISPCFTLWFIEPFVPNHFRAQTQGTKRHKWIYGIGSSRCRFTRVSVISFGFSPAFKNPFSLQFALGNSCYPATNVQVPVFATDGIWECLIAQLCDVLVVRKAEQSVLCGDLSNRADKSILVKLWSSIFVVNQYVEGLPIRKCVCVNGFCWAWRGQENTWREKQKQIFDHSAQDSEKFETKKKKKKKSELAKKRTASALQQSVKPVKHIENNITWRCGCNSAIFFLPTLARINNWK